MYGGGFIFEENTTKKTVVEQHDDPELLALFEAKIDRGEKIEPHDWMPTEYRRQLLRMIEQHAHSEIIGALPEGTWITRAPTLKRKLALIAKVQDEVGHGQLLYAAAETLGKPREQMMNDLLTGKSKYSNVFNYPAKTWADIAVIGFFCVRANCFHLHLQHRAKTSYCLGACNADFFHLSQQCRKPFCHVT